MRRYVLINTREIGSSNFGSLIFPAIFCLLLSSFLSVKGQIIFTEVTDEVGFDYAGESWGAAWGDADMDGWPDLFTGNHYRGSRLENKPPSIYINNFGSSFSEISLTGLAVDGNDFHGGSWADIDGDGDQDLMVTTGRNQPVWLAYNTTGRDFTFHDRAVGNGEIGRGRQVIYWDLSGDGLLDMVIPMDKPFTSSQQSSSIYKHNLTSFGNVSSFIGFEPLLGSNLGTLLDVDGDRNLELLLVEGRGQVNIFDNGSIPFVPRTVWSKKSISDIVPADFNGDLLTDLLVLYSGRRAAANKLDDGSLGCLLIPNESEMGIRFKGTPPLKFEFRHGETDSYQLTLGDESAIPDTTYFGYRFGFSLPGYPGKNLIHTAGVDKGIYLGYDSLSETWTLSRSTDIKEVGLAVLIRSVSGDSLQLVESLGFDASEPFESIDILFNNGDSLVNATSSLFTSAVRGGYTAVAGDFDNDMDLDLYISIADGISSSPNLVGENLGAAGFVFTAESNSSSLGFADATTSVDFNNDGFLDIFLTNGGGIVGGGLDQLLQNNGNANNFLSINLEGTLSNIDGVGASLLLYAGGIVQLREQNGGAHLNSQNHQRIHFGLGSNTFADSLVVFWPSGIIQRVDNIAANQFLLLTEAATTASRTAVAKSAIQLHVFPNPAQEFISVTFDEAFQSAKSYLIRTVDGRLMQTGTFTLGQNLDISGLEVAAYFFELLDEEGRQLSACSFVVTR